jgi:YidC/Oxa1 family membrane protein insertase
MNFKDVLLSAVFALSLSFGFQYFFFNGKQGVQSENTFVAPQEKREYKPLNIEVDFFDHKRVSRPVLTDLELDWGHASFSTEGASLESIDFTRQFGGSIKTIRTIFPVTETERANRCFLVGLQEQTPFYYTLDSFDDFDDSYVLEYSAGNNDCFVKKTFVVNKIKPSIILNLEVTPKKDQKNIIEPRIFYPAPLMPDIRENDIVSSCVIDNKNAFAKKRVDQLDVHKGWFAPTLFGSDSRYFVHSMITDKNNFTRRAYYKLEDRDRLFSVLEGPAVDTQTSWEIAFYFGPKELEVISVVDPRLEDTFEYSGWFAPIAKLMLYLLRWFYTYLHNYGFALIALTLFFQVLLLPFTLFHNEETFKKQQAEYQKKLAILKHRFADQPDKLAAEQAELMRKEGLPGIGCLIPILTQLPLFLALRSILASSFELYQAPMLWISDLSVKDPYYIIPALIVIMMLIQDGKVDPQQRINKLMMAMIFGAITTSFSAGLALYILSGRVFGFIHSLASKYFNVVYIW